LKKRIVLHPIGWVSNQVPGPRHHEWGEVVSDITLDEELAPALDGIEGFSHLIVLFWIAGVTAEERKIQKLHPRDRDDVPLVGIFATHAQYRPNPIGLTVVRLLERQGNRLRVAGLDAYDGTPVLDIKSYNPEREIAADARVPDWMERVQTER
jgi:tRNA-Thr(GGU) m(6)t(6)A37 methyltransferase TsaA